MTYLAKHGKQYASKSEFEARLEIFKTNYQYIDNHNRRNDVTFALELNHLSDMTQEELNKMNGYKYNENKELRVKPTKYSKKSQDIGSINWAEKGALPDVKDQGSCGSCWAFSAVGAFEAAEYIKHGNLISFSEQELVDCVYRDDSGESVDTCETGGEMDDAFLYLEKVNECRESCYPYAGFMHHQCRASGCDEETFYTSDYVDIIPGDTEEMDTIIQQQPIAVAVAANQNWFSYKDGYLTADDCSSDPAELNHGVLLVGIDFEAKQWIVRNSWGTKWGQNGYIRLAAGNTCGIANAASYPSVV